MLTDKQRIEEMHRRVQRINQKNAAARSLGMRVAVLTAGLLFVIMVGLGLPVIGDVDNAITVQGMMASIFAYNKYMGYVVVIVIAALVGICVGAICYYVKKKNSL
ncbi:MAG: hypothetical protein IJ115_08405 [Erysipelotrichaceae bacterium]|nr:hypothetical protein [Erysipelotrichaceae bacterium]